MDGNLSSLIKAGKAAENELQEVWDDIQQQYADAIGGQEHKQNQNLVKDAAILHADYTTILLLIDTLRVCYVKQFADELNKLLRTDFRFDITKLDRYDATLDKCLTRAKAIKLQLQIKEEQLRSTQSESEGRKPTREYFIEILASLSDHSGARITDDITTYEFCFRVKTASQQIDKTKR